MRGSLGDSRAPRSFSAGAFHAHDVARARVGPSHTSAHAVKASPFTAPSTIVGAMRPARRRRATCAVDFRWPCGIGLPCGFLRWMRLLQPLPRGGPRSSPSVDGVGPDRAPGVGLVEQASQLRAVVARGVGRRPGADQPVAAVDADMVLVAEHRDGDLDALRAIRRRLAFEYFTVQRASRPSAPACEPQPQPRMRPSFSARFSSSVLRCFGAATTVASTICPPMRSSPQPGASRRSAGTAPRSPDAADRGPRQRLAIVQIEFASAPGPPATARESA